MLYCRRQVVFQRTTLKFTNFMDVREYNMEYYFFLGDFVLKHKVDRFTFV